MSHRHRVVLLLSGLALGACIPMQPRQPSGSGGGGGGGDPYASNPGGDPEPGGGGEAAGAPAGPQTVSVTIRSSCPRTVKVFYGEKPKYGSGTNSSISSNSVQSHTFRVGDSFWIIDDSENGVSQYTIRPNTSTIEIASSCSSFR
jgi:hypothetical protein